MTLYLLLQQGSSTPTNIGMGANNVLTISEYADTGSLDGQAIAYGTLTASEQHDAGNISAVIPLSIGTLATSEQYDIANVVGKSLFPGVTNGIVQLTLFSGQASPNNILLGTPGVDYGALNISEHPDAGAFSATVVNAAALTATEQPDVVAFVAEEVNSGLFAFSEQPDVVVFVAEEVNSGLFAFSEQHDVGDIIGEGVISSVLASTEHADTVLITTEQEVNSGLFAFSEQHDVGDIIGEGVISSVLASTEHADTVLITTEQGNPSTLTITEYQDFATIYAIEGVIVYVNMGAQERGDSTDAEGVLHGPTWVYEIDGPRPYQGLHGP
jgi:hypothetical protein